LHWLIAVVTDPSQQQQQQQSAELLRIMTNILCPELLLALRRTTCCQTAQSSMLATMLFIILLHYHLTLSCVVQTALQFVVVLAAVNCYSDSSTVLCSASSAMLQLAFISPSAVALVHEALSVLHCDSSEAIITFVVHQHAA
jgi:hypothetical protein